MCQPRARSEQAAPRGCAALCFTTTPPVLTSGSSLHPVMTLQRTVQIKYMAGWAKSLHLMASFG